MVISLRHPLGNQLIETEGASNFGNKKVDYVVACVWYAGRSWDFTTGSTKPITFADAFYSMRNNYV